MKETKQRANSFHNFPRAHNKIIIIFILYSEEAKKNFFFVVAGFFIFFGNDTYNNVDEHTHGPKERKIAGRKSLEAFHVAETTNDDNGACVCGQTREWLTVTGAGDDDDDDEDSRSKKKKKKKKRKFNLFSTDNFPLCLFLTRKTQNLIYFIFFISFMFSDVPLFLISHSPKLLKL